MNLEQKKILITGATGSLGKQLCYLLHQRGVVPIAHCRGTSNQDYIKALGLEIRLADLRNHEQLKQLVQGIDIIIHTAAIVNFRGDRMTQFTGVNTFGAMNLYQAAAGAGVKRFVQVSSVVAVGAQPGHQDNSDLPDESMSFNLGHLRVPYVLSKEAAEIELFKLARAEDNQSTELVIVSPSIIIAPSRSGDDRRKAEKLMSKPFLPTLANRINLVDLRDVAETILVATSRGRSGERYILAGENLSVTELLRAVGDRLNLRPTLIKLPRWPLFVLAQLNDLRVAVFNKSHRRFYPDLVRLLEYDWVYSSKKASEELGFAPRPLAETLDDLLTNNFTGTWQA